MSEITLNAELLEKLSPEDRASLTATAKALAEKNDKNAAEEETLISVVKALNANIENQNKLINEAASTKSLEEADEKFNALAQEKLVEHFKALPANDPKRQEIFESLAKEYSTFNVALVLEGTDLQKTLLKPVSKSNVKVDEYNEFRKSWDNAMILTAARQAITAGGDADSVRITDSNILFENLEKLKALGEYGADSVIASLKNHIAKAHGTTVSGNGLEQIPTLLSSNMVEDVWLNLNVASLFRRYPMPGKNFTVPIRTTRMRGYTADENVSDTVEGAATPFLANFFTPTSVGTSTVSFVARKYGAISFVSDELDQDSTLPILDMIREDLIYGIADGIEDGTLNGTYGLSQAAVRTFMDNAAAAGGNRLWSETTAARDARALWDGLRFSFFKSNVVSIDGAVVTAWKSEGLDSLRNARKKLGKYGATSVDDLVWIISPEFHMELLKLNEVITVEKYGPNATVHTGEIGKIDGIPIVISSRMYNNLNNLGYYSNGVATTAGAGNGSLTGVASDTSTTKTSAIIVNKRGFGFGDRMTLRVESERSMLSDQRAVKASWRGDFKKLFQTAEPLVGMVRNLA